MRPQSSPLLLAAGLALLLPAVRLSSQQPDFFLVPSAGGSPLPGNPLPFAGGPMRYQQVYRASDIASQVGPVRIQGIRFRGASSGQQGGTVNMDLAIAHAPAVVTGFFDNNLAQDRLQILSRQQVQLPSPSSTAWMLHFDFSPREFVWNGVSDIVIDVKIYSNSNNNQPFNYHLATRSAVPGSVRRLFATGSPSATAAQIDQTGVGLETRFDYRAGINLAFGAGCQGLGGFVPSAGASGPPLVGTLGFEYRLSQARHQVPAVLLLGSSRTAWGQVALPLDLSSMGANGCFLLVNPLILTARTTVGGSPGTGSASVTVPIPAITDLIGMQLVTQWLVADDSRNPAGFVMSTGLITVIGI